MKWKKGNKRRKGEEGEIEREIERVGREEERDGERGGRKRKIRRESVKRGGDRKKKG